MDLSRKLSRNIFSGWVGLLVQLAVMMLLTPLVLRELGGSRYGVWALLTTITGYYGLLDAGTRVSIARGITRYWTLRDWQRMNCVASAGLAMLLVCAAALLVVTVACAVLATAAFQLPPELASEFRWCILAVGTSAALQFCFFVHSAALGALQRYDLANMSQVVTQILYACGVPLVLLAGWGLIGLSLWLTATNVLSYVIRWRLARLVLPELKLSLRLVDRAGLAEFAHFGFWQFLVNLAQQVIGCSDALVIAIALNTTAVAPFYLASRVARYFGRFFVPVGNVFFPAIIQLDAVGGAERIRRLYLRGSRLLWLLSIGLGYLSALWASEFFALWVGERQAGFDGRLSELFGILLVAAVVTAPQQISLPAFLALRRQHVLAGLLVAEALCNIALSLLLVHRYGLVGMAWGTCLPAVVFQGLLHPLCTCRLLGIPLAAYVRESLARPLLFAGVLLGLSSLRPESIAADWLPLVAAGALTGIAVAGAAVLVGLDPGDREQLVYTHLGRLRRRLAARRALHEGKSRESTTSPAAVVDGTR